MILKKIVLNMYFWPMFLLVTTIGLGLTPFILLTIQFLPGVSLDRTTRQAIRIYGWILIRVVPFMAPVVLDDRSGGFTKPVIFTPNHNSSIDPFLFAMLPLENAFVTSWPFKIPLYNFFMHLAGYINSTRGWQHVQKRGQELLKAGCSLIIWPEGHRSRTGQMGRFKKGAFKLALATGRQIVPVCIIGSQQVLPPGDIFLSPGRIKIILLPAITPVGTIDNQDDIKALQDKTKTCIAEELLKHTTIKDRAANALPTELSFHANNKNLSNRP
ncbi:MAG: lysophospholipid acyltransferase family protein [Thermodesulfobacteriota bacterium]